MPWDTANTIKYPLVNIHIAIENGDLVRGFTHSFRMVDLSIVFSMFTRWYGDRGMVPIW